MGKTRETAMEARKAGVCGVVRRAAQLARQDISTGLAQGEFQGAIFGSGGVKRVVLVGYGRVGSLIGKALDDARATYSVIEDREDLVELLTTRGIAVVPGNAISKDTMEKAGVAQADLMFVTVPDGFEAGRIVELARTLVKQAGGTASIIAKIERAEAITALESIIEASDAIMVARGDLGVEMLPEQVPPLQKKIVSTARRMGKPVVVATQMLESMIVSPSPTRLWSCALGSMTMLLPSQSAKMLASSPSRNSSITTVQPEAPNAPEKQSRTAASASASTCGTRASTACRVGTACFESVVLNGF